MNPGKRAVAGQRDQPVEADPLLDLGALGRRCAGRSRGSRAGARDPRRRARRARASAPRARSRPRDGSAASARSVARHQSSGSCSAQPGRGVESGYSSSALASTSPVGRDRERLDAARADVEPDEERLLTVRRQAGPRDAAPRECVVASRGGAR